MPRVSTYGNYQSALLDLMSAQTRAQQAQERVSTEKVATELGGFGRTSETLTALKSMQSRIQGFIDTGEAVSARLASQAFAFDRIAEGADGARQAIADALASGRVDGLMLDLQGRFQIAQDGLNTQHQGRYLFSGGRSETPPVAAATLTELTLNPVPDLFANDTLRQSSRVDEGAVIETGFLASDVGSTLFTIFRDIQLFQMGQTVTVAANPGQGTFVPAGANTINAQPSDDVRRFLTSAMQRFDAAHLTVTDQAARNGSLQNRVDGLLKSQAAQQVSLEELVGKKTDVDMAQALTELELAQVAIQASAQVVNQLRQVSLLNILT
jgi:flagellar hook-associated protein 3 FlgL